MRPAAHLGAARNQRRRAAEHAVPHRPRSVVGGVTGTQQVAFELSPQRRIRLLTDTRHLLVSWVRPRPYHGVARKRRCDQKAVTWAWTCRVTPLRSIVSVRASLDVPCRTEYTVPSVAPVTLRAPTRSSVSPACTPATVGRPSFVATAAMTKRGPSRLSVRPIWSRSWGSTSPCLSQYEVRRW